MQEMAIEGFRLSPQQKRLWLLQREEQQPYQAQCVVLLSGELDTHALKTALTKVIERHEVLRTDFRCVAGLSLPLQVVAKDCQLLVNEYGSVNGNRQKVFDELLRKASEDLVATGLRVSLIRLSVDEHALVLSFPAMYGDTTGLRNLIANISSYYGSIVLDEPIADEPVQYADLAEWQIELLNAEDAEIGKEYWRKQNRIAQETPKLPYGRETRDAGFVPQSVNISIDAATTKQLDAIVEKYETTASVFILSCWQVLLWRLTEQSHFVVGTSFNGRNYQGLESALGLFVKYLPITAVMDETLPFSQLLTLVTEIVDESCEYQEYFTWDEREEEGYFPYCYEYEEAAANCVAGRVKFTIVNEYACTERYEVKLSCRRIASGLQLEWHYDANCYEAVDIERLGAQYRRLLQSVLVNDEARLELEVVSEQEREQLAQWNETAVAYEAAASILELFERQAAERAGEVAVVCGRERLTYEELNERANQLGHYLQRLGVGPEVRVGLCVERSLAMVVGVLGILKAGGAYVPLDASYPTARLEQMLADSGAAVLLREAAMVEQLAASAVKEINLEREWSEIAQESSTNVKAAVTGDNLAYVIYTSGSTGRPKGVGITYQNLLHTTRAREHYYGRGAVRFLLLSSVAFDSSVAGLFWTLCGGGRLVVPEEGQQREAHALVQLVREQEVTHLLSLPSLYELLLEVGHGGELASLAGVIVAGEVCGAGLVQRHWEVAPQAVLYNEYGPTEGSVWSTVQRCSSAATVVPIGCAIANVQVYVLDERMGVAPLGVRGELYVGGAGVSRGYLNDAAQTAQQYVPDPFSGVRGARMYRTGDVGRYRREGELEFVGRVDGQVKIRGYRVEVGEIEAVLSAHERVASAVVVLRVSERGEARLVGYVVTPAGQEISGTELRQWLGERLPEYMVPWRVVVLAEWPLQPNGKVDRQRLPEPEAVVEGERREARTPVEAVIQSIWEEVLSVKELSVTANFFELGGHSLLATQVMSRVREALAMELPVRSLFAQPTVRGLAAEIEAQLQAAHGVTLPSITAGRREGELPLSYAQQRLWLGDQLTAGSALYNVAAAVRLTGALNVPALKRTLTEIIRRHEVLRSSFPARQGEPVQVIAPQVEFVLAQTDLSALPTEEREQATRRLAAEEARTPFDLAVGPLVRARLLRLGEAEHVVLFTMHHIVSDGWSMGVLIQEVSQLYEAYSGGGESPLAELPVQYADYALWQREWLTGEVLEKQLAYWRQQLAGAPETLALPLDKARPAVQSYRGGVQRFELAAELSEQLKALSRQESSSLFMTLLAAFQALLHYYSQQTDIVIGTNVANRNYAETEGLIGFFVNTLALRCDLTGDPDFKQLLKRVREVCLEAYARQDLPFEKLIAALQTDRDLSRSPLFQVKLEFGKELMKEFELHDVRLSAMEISNEVVRYDLHLFFTEGAQCLKGNMVYDTDLFEAKTIEWMCRQLETLMHIVVEEPEVKLSVLNQMLAEADRERQIDRERKAKEARLMKYRQVTRQLIEIPVVNPAG